MAAGRWGLSELGCSGQAEPVGPAAPGVVAGVVLGADEAAPEEFSCLEGHAGHGDDRAHGGDQFGVVAFRVEHGQALGHVARVWQVEVAREAMCLVQVVERRGAVFFVAEAPGQQDQQPGALDGPGFCGHCPAQPVFEALRYVSAFEHHHDPGVDLAFGQFGVGHVCGQIEPFVGHFISLSRVVLTII